VTARMCCGIPELRLREEGRGDELGELVGHQEDVPVVRVELVLVVVETSARRHLRSLERQGARVGHGVDAGHVVDRVVEPEVGESVGRVQRLLVPSDFRVDRSEVRHVVVLERPTDRLVFEPLSDVSDKSDCAERTGTPHQVSGRREG